MENKKSKCLCGAKIEVLLLDDGSFSITPCENCLNEAYLLGQGDGQREVKSIYKELIKQLKGE